MTTPYEELTTGPLAAEVAPFITSGNDGAIEAIMNRKDIVVYGDVAPSALMAWGAKNGQRAVFEDTAADTNSPYRSIALTLKDALVAKQPLDLADASVQQMVAAWTAGGKATQEMSDALYTLSEKLISRAEQTGLVFNIQTIAKALRG